MTEKEKQQWKYRERKDELHTFKDSTRNNRRLSLLHRSTTLSHLFHLNRGEC